MKELVASLLIALSVVAAAPAAEDGSSEGHPDTTGWTTFFAGDLSDAIAPKGVWSVEDGVLTASEDQAIWTKKPYGDAMIDLEFKNAPGTNSGVILYCNNMEDWIPTAIEIQIADDYAEKWASSPKSWQCGAIFGHQGPTKRTVKPAGQWNRMTIICKGQTIKVVLNGELVNEIDMSRYTSATHNPDGTEIPAWLKKPLAELPTHGHVGLQGKHAGAPIYFRNVKIKELQ
jgi:hypothetical protein